MTQHSANNPSAASTDQVEAVAAAPASAGATDVGALLDELERLSDETDVWAGAADEAAQAVGDGIAAAATSVSPDAPEPATAHERAAAAMAAELDPADSEAALRHLDSVLAGAAESLADGADVEEAIAEAAEAHSTQSNGGPGEDAASRTAAADDSTQEVADGFSTVDDVVREVAEEFDAGDVPPASTAPVPSAAAAKADASATRTGADPGASRLLIDKDGTRSGKAAAAPVKVAPKASTTVVLTRLLGPLAVLALPMKLLSVSARDTIGHLAAVTLVCGGGVWYAVKYVPRESAPLAMSDLVVFKTQEDAPGHGAAKADDHGGGGKKASKDAHGKGDAHGKKPAEKKSGSSGHAKPAAKGGKDKKDAKGGGHH